MPDREVGKSSEEGGAQPRDLTDTTIELRLLALNVLFEGVRAGSGGSEFIRFADEADVLIKRGNEAMQKRRPIKSRR